MNLFLDRLKSAEAPLVIAHRGASAHAPENTMAAARRAVLGGADAWEFDVHLTRDGVPVVIHDESLLRTTDVASRFLGDPRAKLGYPVSKFDLEEVQSLDAGSWFVGDRKRSRSAFDFGTIDALSDDERDEFRSGTVRVPTLREALEFTVEAGWLANVELKTFPNRRPGLVETVMSLVESLAASSRVLISSFDHEDVAVAGRWRPVAATGALFESPLHRAPNYVKEVVGADCAHPSAGALGAGGDVYRDAPGPATLRGDLVAGFRSAGLPVLVYTVNDARTGGLADHLAEIGVSALFTDFPRETRDALSSRRSG